MVHDDDFYVVSIDDVPIKDNRYCIFIIIHSSV